MMFDLNAIMSTDVITVPLSASLVEARSLMKENRFHHLPVVNDGGDFIGLLTQADVLAATDSILPVVTGGKLVGVITDTDFYSRRDQPA
jgi:CBS domain-containing protein